MKVLQIDIDWDPAREASPFQVWVCDRTGDSHYMIGGDSITRCLREMIEREADSGFGQRQAFAAQARARAAAEGES